MDAKLYFACSVVVVELVRLFRPVAPALHKDSENRPVTTAQPEERSELEVEKLAKSLEVLPHPEGCACHD